LFIVEDNGIGISPKNQEKLFQEFGQAEVSISRRFGGSGMGLFICKELVRLFNGTIGCESTLGEGSQFWFTAWLQASDTDSTTGSDNNNNYFSMEQAMMVNINYERSCSNIEEASESSSDSVVNDISSEEASDSNPTSSSKRKQQHKAKRKEDLRVLIAEDDRINRQVLLKFCNSLGYTNAHVVSDGRRAVKKCSKHHFDVILMDNSMPVSLDLLYHLISIISFDELIISSVGYEWSGCNTSNT
jgi:CheY-like chemotaxis protein